MTRQPALCFGNFREPLFEHPANASVQFLTLAPQEGAVGSILYECVLEQERGVRRVSATEHKARFGQLIERSAKFRIGMTGDGSEQLV